MPTNIRSKNLKRHPVNVLCDLLGVIQAWRAAVEEFGMALETSWRRGSRALPQTIAACDSIEAKSGL